MSAPNQPFRISSRLLGIFIAAIIALVGVFLLDYLNTRSTARLALLLAKYGPGTSIDAYMREFGKPAHHFIDPVEMKSWSTSNDPELLSRTELYYFYSRGLPYRYVIVYADKTTRRAVAVSWKPM